MCGICGYIDFSNNSDNTEVIHRMVAMLDHRGPDQNGYYSGLASCQIPYSAFLGHTRLKVIDLSDVARQPLPNENEKIWVVFNGEIYNFKELRNGLEKRGHLFRSNSDTEVIVHAYEEYGVDALNHLDGMFAFAIWDASRQELFLARDRTGKKPLYYYYDGRYFAFASEIKAITICPWVQRTVDINSIPEYFTYGYVSASRTMYKGINQLFPASYLVVGPNGLKGPNIYWKLPPLGENVDLKSATSTEEISTEIYLLLKEAVRKRLMSDVPLGALLSGGLDSSIIVGLMSSLLENPVRTFSIGFTDDRSFDERSYASIVAKHFKTIHTEVLVEMDALPIMERLLWHHDQPYGDSSSIPTFLLSQVARQNVTVALNGDGSDELFAGYDRFRGALAAERIPTALMKIGNYATRLLPRRHGYFSLKRRMELFFTSADGFALSRYLEWIFIFNKDMSKRLLIHSENNFPEERLQKSSPVSTKSLLNSILEFNFNTYLPYDLNIKMDRMSMANGLETRSPFLDTALMEYVAQLPPGLKIHRGKTKYILRQAFQDFLPPLILNRPKHGFGMPLGLWFKGKLGTLFKDLLFSKEALSRQYLAEGILESLLQEHIDGLFDHSYRLWTILQFELWLRLLQKPTDWKPNFSQTGITDFHVLN